MPRSRIRVSKRQDWNSENMRIAVKEVIEKRMTFRNACIQFNVPKSTLERKVRYNYTNHIILYYLLFYILFNIPTYLYVHLMFFRLNKRTRTLVMTLGTKWH